MKLFLASSMKEQQSLDELGNFLKQYGKSIEESRIVYIPTAGNGEGFGSWKTSTTLGILKKIAKNLSVIDLEECTYRNISNDIKRAEVLWIAGGYCAYLMYWIRRTQLDLMLPEMFKNGLIYVGSSAGSMVCSKTLWAAELFEDAEYGAGMTPALGYIDFEINPHYTDDKYDAVKKKWKHGELYLLKDGEAITYVDGEIKFLGEKRIIK